LRWLRRRVADLEAEREIVRRLAAFEGGPAGRERIYRFVRAESANFSLVRLCQVCGVARSGYYDSLGRDRAGPGEALLEEAYLANQGFDIWRRSRRRYGAPRVTAALRKQGVEVNEKRVARLMGGWASSGTTIKQRRPVSGLAGEAQCFFLSPPVVMHSNVRSALSALGEPSPKPERPIDVHPGAGAPRHVTDAGEVIARAGVDVALGAHDRG
jgi:hypothetical protein